MTTAPRPSRRLEILVGLVLTAVIVCLHAVRFVKAGALWRDEAAAVGLATLSPVREVVRHFPHEAFPLLVPAAIRTVAWASGNSDWGFRAFGMLVGLSILAALWWTTWTVRRSPPLLSLALLGFNSAFLVYGDSVRGYGLGTFFMVLTAGLVWRVVERPTSWRIASAALGAVASVQCLLHNPPLVLAICLGGVAVAWRRGAWRLTAVVLLIGVAAAISLLPYWALLRSARGWDVLVRKPVALREIWLEFHQTLAASGLSNAWFWTLLFFSGLAVELRSRFKPRQVRSPAVPPDDRESDLLLFAGTALLLAVGGCFCFLKLLSYPTRPWYYIAVMGLAAVLLDLIFDTLRQARWVRPSRLVLVIALAASSLPLTWSQVQVRQTNVDLVAVRLGQLAAPDDLIFVYPWHNGISFERYYRGPTPWMTLPPLNFHRFHRYDLVQAQMNSPDTVQPLRPLFDGIRTTLVRGHRLWIVGNFPAAPESLEGRSPENVISITWSIKVAEFLRASARHLENVRVESYGPVSPFEDLPLKFVEGWSGPLSSHSSYPSQASRLALQP
ncbi:MAG TPA: hypothetical protein VN578_08170 [Candidatus Binatia bacterium]|jgi:hypothetical protein|nr:hypothetical protein [Candidatus Binatia bacterium]